MLAVFETRKHGKDSSPAKQHLGVSIELEAGAQGKPLNGGRSSGSGSRSMGRQGAGSISISQPIGVGIFADLIFLRML